MNGNIRSHICENVGGIVGKNCGVISNSNSKVTIIGSGRKIGGIAGMSTQGTISNCVNYNTISGEMYSGGICGYSQNTLFDLCGNDADAFIESTYGYTGGIVRIC